MLLIRFMFITGIPYAFKQSGFILGTLLLVIVGVITGLFSYILVPSYIDISNSKHIFIVSLQFYFLVWINKSFFFALFNLQICIVS